MEKERNLNESIINIRVKLQNAGLKKSGKNKSAGFEYFELSDFLPKLNELMLEENINDNFKIEDGIAKLILIKGTEVQEYTIPFVLFDTPCFKRENSDTGEIYEVKSMQDIQYLGALNTYYKRYLYLNAFGITDGDVINSMDNSQLENKVQRATPRQIEVLLEVYKDENLKKLLEANKINSINELPMKKASELIKKINEKKGK